MQKDTAHDNPAFGSTSTRSTMHDLVVHHPERLGCDSERAQEVGAFFSAVRGKWRIPILGSLGSGTLRFNELQRRLTGITQKVLTAQLRQLEQEGFVSRKIYAEVPPRVEYALTPEGKSLLPVIDSTAGWGRQHRKQAIGRVPRSAVS